MVLYSYPSPNRKTPVPLFSSKSPVSHLYLFFNEPAGLTSEACNFNKKDWYSCFTILLAKKAVTN